MLSERDLLITLANYDSSYVGSMTEIIHWITVGLGRHGGPIYGRVCGQQEVLMGFVERRIVE